MSYNVSNLKILVVEDSVFSRKILCAILNGLDIKSVIEAPDGKVALQCLKSFDADVVIADCIMENMDGLEMLRQIRNHDVSSNPYVPVIMMSSNTEIGRILEARDMGATEFLAKPVSPKMVLQRLKTVIEKPRDFVRTKAFFGPDRRRHTWEEYLGTERRGGGEDDDGDGEIVPVDDQPAAPPSAAYGLEGEPA